MNEWKYEYPLFKNAAFSNDFLSLAGRIWSEGFSFTWENVTFAACFILSGCDTHIDFLRLFFLVGVICPLMQECSSRLKKLISQAPEDAMFKIRRPVYKRLFKSNHMLRASQKSNVNQTCQQSVFSPKGDCFRIWCTAGAVERLSQMFVYALSPFSFPVLAIFSPFPQTESLFTGYCPPHLHRHNSPACSNCHLRCAMSFCF